MASPSLVSAPGHAAAVGVLLVRGRGGPQSPCLAFPLPPPRGTRLVAEGTNTYLLLAPATSRHDVRCALSRGSGDSDPKEQDDMLGFGAAFQPLVRLGVPPVATRDTHLARASSSSPAPSNFNEDYARLLEVEASRVNCLGLVGQQQVLDEIARSAARLMVVVSMLIPQEMVKLSPEAVKLLIEGGKEELMPPRLETGMQTTRALKIVQAECIEGYIRHYNKIPHIAMHALQRNRNALQNIDLATHICVGNPIRYRVYEWQRIPCVAVYMLEQVQQVRY